MVAALVTVGLLSENFVYSAFLNHRRHHLAPFSFSTYAAGSPCSGTVFSFSMLVSCSATVFSFSVLVGPVQFFFFCRRCPPCCWSPLSLFFLVFLARALRRRWCLPVSPCYRRCLFLFDCCSCFFWHYSWHGCGWAGRATGPSLVGAAKRFSRDDLFTAILDPNRDVSARYRTVRVTTDQDQVYEGVVRSPR